MTKEEEAIHNKEYAYRCIPHSAACDREGRLYCRAANAVLENPVYCSYCPCFTGRDGNGQPVCRYYDFPWQERTDCRTPNQWKKYADGLIGAGLVPVFPDYILKREKTEESIEQALQFAAEAHKRQVRKGTGIPYIVHPMEVLSILRGMTEDPDILMAGVLHDVLEDTPSGELELEQRFGQRVLKLVKKETEDKRRHLPAKDSWKIRKMEMISQIKKEPAELKKIVLADKLSNMRATKRGYDKAGEAIWQRFNVTDPGMHRWYYTTIGEILSELEDTQAYQEYMYLCRVIFGHEQSEG